LTATATISRSDGDTSYKPKTVGLKENRFGGHATENHFSIVMQVSKSEAV
jgi:hypothetical protein